MTIRQLISTLRVILKENTVDSVLSNRDLWSIAWAYTITLIQRETDTKRNIFNLGIFKTKKILMKEVSVTEDYLDIPIDCKIYRSINKISPIVESKFGLITRYITTLDKSMSFNLVTPQSYKDKVAITKGKVNYVFIDNGYLYSTQRYPLLLSALYSDIKEILKESSGCKIMDLDAPIPEYMISSLLQMTPQQLGVFKQVPQDTNITTNPNN